MPRPKKQTTLRQSAQITVRFTPAEREEIAKAAARAKTADATWVRDLAVQVARYLNSAAERETLSESAEPKK